VLAETAYFIRTGGSRGAAYNGAATYDRPAVLAATLALEDSLRAADPNLQFFNWRAEHGGYTMVHLRGSRAVRDDFTTPQRVLSPDQALLAQFNSPVGAPHLGAVVNPTPLSGSRQDALAPAAASVPEAGGPAPVVPELPIPVLGPVAGGRCSDRRRCGRPAAPRGAGRPAVVVGRAPLGPCCQIG